MNDPSRSAVPDLDAIRHVLLDLDGVVWLARRPIPGAAGAVERIRSSGRRVLFVTNNSMSTIESQEAALAAIDIPAAGAVVTSSQAAASLIATGERVLVCGGDGVIQAVTDRGAVAVRSDEAEVGDQADAVIVGLHTHFDYHGLHAAAAAIRGGARFVATNDDATYPTPAGPAPGAGSLVAAVATASGAAPVLAGKPHRPMATLVAERLDHADPATVLMVGDRASTDGRFAQMIGCPFALVRTGVTAPGGVPDDPVHTTLDVADLAAVADTLG